MEAKEQSYLKADLIESMRKRGKTTKAAAERACNLFLDTFIEDYLKEGKPLYVKGAFKTYKRKRKPHKIRDIRSKEIKYTQPKDKWVFEISNKLREEIDVLTQRTENDV